MKLPKLILPFALIISIVSCAHDIPIEGLDDLDRTLQSRSHFEEVFNSRVIILKDLLRNQTDPDQRYAINLQLADEYKAVSIDTCLSYLSENALIAKEDGDAHKQMETALLTALEQVRGGYYAEAAESVSILDDKSIPEDLQIQYYTVIHKLSGEIFASSSSPSVRAEKIANRDSCRSILLSIVPPESYQWHYLKYEEADEALDSEGKNIHSNGMVECSKPNSRNYAEACYFRYRYLEAEGDESNILWLCKSAIADEMCATRDYASLSTLARALFWRGYIEKSFRYLADYCMPDALSYNGKLRPWQICQFFFEIQRAYEDHTRAQKQRLLVLMIVVSLLFVLSLVLLFIIRRNQRVLNKAKQDLQASYERIERRNKTIKEADMIKQEYITQFLSMLSENVNVKRRYKNQMTKYIRHGLTDDIKKEIEALPSENEDINQFTKVFDETFINIFPNFVSDFNELLEDGNEIKPKGEDLMTPELRVFALIKLGITDSSKIASLLHYSPNTIYNYRAKIKNMAKGDRAEFENKVRAIE